MFPRRGVVLAGLIMLLLAVAVSGCTIRPGTGAGAINFQRIFEQQPGKALRVERVFELDTTGNRQNEWLVLYRFDPTLQQEWLHSPIRGIVYGATQCDPPVILNWPLPAPANDYLGEGAEITAYMADWLASTDPTQAQEELIIDGPGRVNTLSIFRYHDRLMNPCVPPDPTMQGFSLLGFFRADGDIEWDEQRREMVTLQRTAFERSQLAIRSVYNPNLSATGETFLTPAGVMKRPDEQSVDFLYGRPRAPTESPYPEKAVAAFYLHLGQDNQRAASFLTDGLAAEFNQRSWGLPVLPDQLSRVLIYSISYTPDPVAERAHLEREVTVVVAAVDINGQRLEPRRVTWRLVGIPIPGEEDCEWRLDGIEGIVVSEGLGSLLPEPAEVEGVALVQ
jgi:hypothetical protein